VKGAEELVVYSSTRPRLYMVNGKEGGFPYKDAMVAVNVEYVYCRMGG